MSVHVVDSRRQKRDLRPDDGPALVVGFARTGHAVARALVARGVAVTAVDDAPAPQAVAAADALGVPLVAHPDHAALAAIASGVSLVIVSPGVPPSHPIFELAGDRVSSEVELAYRCSDTPVVAVTGTNGKTTVTTLVAAMLRASGVDARPLGNIGEPYVSVLEEPPDVAVVEVSSFQLAYTSTFRPRVGAWLNLAEDHLDWHPSMEEYAAAKARVWASQQAEDVAVANGDDPAVMAHATRVRSRLVTFGSNGDYRVVDGRFVGPSGRDLGSVEVLPRRFPHDVANALAALATSLEAGATPEACVSALAAARPLEHRVELVATIAGVEYYDDSKATTPSAVLAALGGFTSVVLIAGGRNKGLDLSVLARDAPASTSVRGVVAIGEAADAIGDAFAGLVPVVRAASMDEAVRVATALARGGDAVLLSPGCASFDWYRSYEERGRDFRRVVGTLRAVAGGR